MSAVFDIVAIVALTVVAEIQRRRIPNREKSWFTHRVSGTEHATRRTFMTLAASDFCDYVVMLAITLTVSTQMYGASHPLNTLNAALCVAMALAFPVRHGIVWRLPTIVTEPWHALNVVLGKLDNFPPALPLALAVMLAERAAIRAWPEVLLGSSDLVYVQYVEWVFVAAFLFITALRLVIYGAHLRQRDHVFTFLRRSQLRKCVGFSSDAFREHVDLAHALFTGVLCHSLAMAPLFVSLHARSHSLALLPVRLCFDLAVYYRFWFYEFNRWTMRDHYVAHSSQLAFVYMHSAHHDALPVSMMASHDTGMLEGFTRFCLQPEPYLNPVFALIWFSFSVLSDMVFHQYVPGVFPYSTAVRKFGHHHAEHHFLSLLPLGAAFESPPDLNPSQSVEVDEMLTTYRRKNALWDWLRTEFENGGVEQMPVSADDS